MEKDGGTGALSVSGNALQQLNQGAVDGAQIEQVKGNLYVITKTNMEGMSNFQGANAKYLPKQTFDDRLTLGSGADRDLSSRYPAAVQSVDPEESTAGRSIHAERNMSIGPSDRRKKYVDLDPAQRRGVAAPGQ